MRRIALLGCAAVLMGWAALQTGISQGPLARTIEASRQAASVPFVGVATETGIESNLFPIRATGVSTEPVRRAAEQFLAALSEEQRKLAAFPVDDREWRMWINIHLAERQGIEFTKLTEEQRDLAFNVLAAGLSAKGLKQSRDIMRLNYTIGEIVNNFRDYGDLLYNFSFMGTPSATEPWGWQLEGHHLIINYFVLGDQVVMTPTFMGSEPIRATSGKYAGTEILQAETAKGLAMMRSLNAQQQAQAQIAANKTANNNLGEAYKDNLKLDYAGVPGSALTASQREQLLDLIGEYVANMDDGHARVKMEEVRRHLDRTYFAWIGGFEPASVFYYRIHSPVILIEFDHQLPVAMPGPRVPNREHIHTVVRTPNGNDYGKDLLRQHYEQSHRAE